MKAFKKRRVVITGFGVISSLGIGWQDFWSNLIAGKNGISKVRIFDTKAFDRHVAGEITDFEPTKFIPKKQLGLFGRASQLAIAASKLALKDAGLKVTDIREANIGLCIGTTMGEPQIMERLDEMYYPDGKKLKVDFSSAFAYPASSISSSVANALKLSGYNIMFANACAAGNYSIGHAFDLIQKGKHHLVFAGGADALSRIAFSGFNRLIAIAPEKCQPFDRNRKGMIPGEGAGMLLLESLESARNRKATIYAEILGYGMSCDAHHMTNPSADGVAACIRRAITHAGIEPDEVDYISAHGTGTIENDKAECLAMKKVFGAQAYQIPISSIKSMLGHTMGAASALEAIACCLALAQGQIPPTINFEYPDDDCDLDVVPNFSRKGDFKIALNNSQAFGGNNACLIFRRINE